MTRVLCNLAAISQASQPIDVSGLGTAAVVIEAETWGSAVQKVQWRAKGRPSEEAQGETARVTPWVDYDPPILLSSSRPGRLDVDVRGASEIRVKSETADGTASQNATVTVGGVSIGGPVEHRLRREILAQSRPSSTSLAAFFSPDAGIVAGDLLLEVCNQSGAVDTFRLCIPIRGTDFDEASALRWDVAVPPNVTLPVVIGGDVLDDQTIALAPGTASALTFTLWGSKR